MTDPPVKDRCQRRDAVVRKIALVPALTALRSIPTAAHLDAAIADRALALADTGDHQQAGIGGTLGELSFDRAMHRLDLDLPRAPPERVVVRWRYTAAEHVDEEPLVERRPDNLGSDTELR